ncbi:hypothetical protein Ancab_002770 [Ancistrocladus abbreviatus]
MSLFFLYSAAAAILQSSAAVKTSHFTPLPHFIFRRTFVDAKVKWVRDRYLDVVVQREKNLKPSLSVKHFILSSSPPPLSLLSLSLHKHQLNLPSSTLKFIQSHPSLFTIFRPPSNCSSPHVKLTPQFLSLHNEEQEIHESDRESAAIRLAKLLMLARACQIPLSIIDDLKFDLGLPNNYILDLVSCFPDYFRICELIYDTNDDGVHDGNGSGNSDRGKLGLELVSWRKEFAISAIERKVMGDNCDYECRRGVNVRFPLSFTPGFDLQKKVKNWTEEWQCLPYISPYEDAFHLAPSSDQAEKWTVAVLHELLSLLVSKKTELRNIFRLGDYLGFGMRFKKAVVHHPGIFYVSNKIRTQTVVLREAYRKDFLQEKHPLMGMRHRYIYLMSKSNRQEKEMKKLTARRYMLSTKYIREKRMLVRSIEA